VRGDGGDPPSDSSAAGDRAAVRLGLRLSRRRFVGGVAGIAALAAVGGIGQACSPRVDPTADAPRLTLGSHYADEVPRRAMQAVVDGFTQRTGIQVAVNTVAPGPYQERIAAYLQGTPDDVFTWFGGNRMRFFAERELVSDISDVWAELPDQSDAARRASTGNDGRQYFVPFITYPWVVVYRRSHWQRAGYRPPATVVELFALAAQMRTDGIVPLAFGNREGWPAMGTFDIINLRINGYDFHIRLLEGQERWTQARVRRVFENWRDLLPLHQERAQGRTWQEAARSMLDGEAGMIYLGSFAAEQATPDELDDLEIFPFPVWGTEYDGEMAVEAPVNGFMLSREPDNPTAAREFLRHVATAEAQLTYVTANPSRIATATDADVEQYTPLQQRMAQVIAGAGRLAQFFDRDTRPDFAGADGMQQMFQDFLADPEQDLDAFLGRVQQLWDSLD
jgi:multiple sugar transport system substrate-binding protein